MACRTSWLVENSIDFTHSICQKPRSTKLPYSVLFYLNLLSNCSCCNCVSDEFCPGEKLPWGCWRNTLDSLLLSILKRCLWSVISFPQLGLLEQNLYSFALLWAYYRKSSAKPSSYLNLSFLQVSETYYEESQSAVSKDDFCYCQSHWTATLKLIVEINYYFC